MKKYISFYTGSANIYPPIDMLAGANPLPKPTLPFLDNPALPYSEMSQSPYQPELPDLGPINSSELTVDNSANMDLDSVNNLSASFSCSLNLTDNNSLNQLDKKGSPSEDDKNAHPLPSDNYVANIPTTASNAEGMKSETAIPNMSSDSVTRLKEELENFNKLSEGR